MAMSVLNSKESTVFQRVIKGRCHTARGDEQVLLTAASKSLSLHCGYDTDALISSQSSNGTNIRSHIHRMKNTWRK